MEIGEKCEEAAEESVKRHVRVSNLIRWFDLTASQRKDERGLQKPPEIYVRMRYCSSTTSALEFEDLFVSKPNADLVSISFESNMIHLVSEHKELVQSGLHTNKNHCQQAEECSWWFHVRQGNKPE
jgi:hypothetical protein